MAALQFMQAQDCLASLMGFMELSREAIAYKMATIVIRVRFAVTVSIAKIMQCHLLIKKGAFKMQEHTNDLDLAAGLDYLDDQHEKIEQAISQVVSNPHRGQLAR